MTDQQAVRASSVPIKPAATVMLLRDGRAGLEVFVLQRTFSAAFARGNYVFPGGRVDDADHGVEFEPICDGSDDATASARLGVDRGGLAWLVATIRECFEEAGVLLARPTDSSDIVAFEAPETQQRFTDARHAVHRGERSLLDVCIEEDLQLLTDRIHFVDHWLTPIGEPRRFDTRFFVARAPAGQTPLHDDAETIASRWVGPDEALALWRNNELMMFPPTIVSLEWLSGFENADAAIASAAAMGRPPKRVPRIVLEPDGSLKGIIMPTEDGYDTTPIPEFVTDLHP